MSPPADRPRPPWMPRTPLGWGLALLGLGTLVAGATTLLILVAVIAFAIAPIVVWLAWNVLGFANAIGAPELGFWGIVLLTLFLVGGFGGRIVITLVVWIVDPAWLHGAARLHWPQSSFRVFVAIVLLLAVAGVPGRRHAHSAKHAERRAAEQRA